jgi:H+/Cl- antiporter ClcA
MSTALWILIAVLAVGTIAGGLLRIRAWLQSPAPPEVIEAAHRRDEEKD